MSDGVEAHDDDFRDRFVRLESDVDHLSTYARTEIGSLRSWRHDIMPPVMAALQSTGLRNEQQIGRLTDEMRVVAAALVRIEALPKELEKRDKRFEDIERKVDGHFAASRRRQIATHTMLIGLLVGMIVWLVQTYVIAPLAIH